MREKRGARRQRAAIAVGIYPIYKLAVPWVREQDFGGQCRRHFEVGTFQSTNQRAGPVRLMRRKVGRDLLAAF
jgi:hypothetical protein